MDLLTSLFSTFDFDTIQNFVSEATKHSIVDWTLKIGVVWFIMGRKVNERFKDFQETLSAHFGEVQKGFADLVSEMKELKENVTKDLSNHSQVLGGLTNEVNTIKTRVEKLETKGV